MKEFPMFFNDEMVRALLDGRKTQTRRPVAKVSPDNSLVIRKASRNRDGVYTHVMDAPKHGLCPFGSVGDRIWVREAWADVNLEGLPAVAYRADDDVYSLMDDESFLDEEGAFNYDDSRVSKYEFAAWYADLVSGTEGHWRPSIHMPRWACRILLEITDVRVERVSSISNDDAGKEGYPANPAPYGGEMDKWLWFRQLWDGLYPEQTFRANPWVWVIEFKRVNGAAQ